MKRLVIANVLLITIILGIGFWYYSILPAKVPVHFDLNGRPDRLGNKEELLLLPFLFSSIPLTMVVLFKIRHKIWRHLNVGIDLESLDEEERREAIDECFNFLLKFSLYLGACLLLLEIASFESSMEREIVWWFYPSLILTILSVIPFLIFYSMFVEKWR